MRPSRRVSLGEPRNGNRGAADLEPSSRDRSGRPSSPAFWRLLRIASAVTTTRHVTRALRAVAFEAAALCRADRCALLVSRGDTLLRITGRRVTGSSFGGVKGRTQVPELVERWLAGEIDVESLLSHRLELDDVNRGFELMEAQDGIRSVIDFA